MTTYRRKQSVKYHLRRSTSDGPVTGPRWRTITECRSIDSSDIVKANLENIKQACDISNATTVPSAPGPDTTLPPEQPQQQQQQQQQQPGRRFDKRISYGEF
jgi:hypothetical protein